MDALGWQTLLATEASPNKSLALLRELGSFADAAVRIVNHPSLTEQERLRAKKVYADKLRTALDAGVSVVIRADFPPTMQPMPHPPALFAWGDFSSAHAPCIAIAGTRAATTYGKAVAIKFAEAFARAGVTVVSGGALGIDAAAHRGALSQGGKTIAVMATGVDQVYPAVHSALFGQIRESGCLVSQYAVGSGPTRFRFITRNALIAGLSMGVVIVEAPERSGSLSTAHAANEQGKQVFVVPANIDNTNFKGSHAMIRDGATLVDHPDQVLAALNISVPAQAPQALYVSSSGKKILACITANPLAPEFIVQQTGLDTAEIMAELTMLEIDGLVIKDGSRYAIRP